MRLFLFSLALITTFCTANRSAGQEVVPLSLEECTNYALKHNYSVKNSKLDVMIQVAQNNEITATAYPRINGKGEFDDYLNPIQTFIPGEFFGGQPGTFTPITFTPRYASAANISGSQILFDGSVLVALQARNTVMELARQNGEVTKETVRYNVLRAYNALVIAYRQYDIIKSSLGYARSLQHDLEVTQQNGFAEKIDVERSGVQVNNLATDSIRIGNLLTVSEQVLKYQMGMPITTPIILTDTNIEDHRQNAVLLLEEDKDYNRVPEYNLLNTQLLANEYNVKRYRLAALPSLNVFGNLGYTYSSNNFKDLFNQQYIFSSLVGIQLNVPIFNGLQRINQVREAKLNVEKTKNNIENIKLSIDFQAAQSRTNLKNSLLQVQSQHRNLDLAGDVLALAQKKYKAGVGSNVEVTQAQTDQLNAQNNYFNALLDVINAEADLKKALGLLK